MQARGNLPALEHQRRLDQTGHTGRGLQMAEIGFHRADGQRSIGRGDSRTKLQRAHGLRWDRPRRCPCRAPRRNRLAMGSIPASAHASRTTRAWASGLGSEMPLVWPSEFIAAPMITPWIGSPSAMRLGKRLEQHHSRPFAAGQNPFARRRRRPCTTHPATAWTPAKSR